MLKRGKPNVKPCPICQEDADEYSDFIECHPCNRQFEAQFYLFRMDMEHDGTTAPKGNCLACGLPPPHLCIFGEPKQLFNELVFQMEAWEGFETQRSFFRQHGEIIETTRDLYYLAALIGCKLNESQGELTIERNDAI